MSSGFDDPSNGTGVGDRLKLVLQEIDGCTCAAEFGPWVLSSHLMIFATTVTEMELLASLLIAASN